MYNRNEVFHSSIEVNYIDDLTKTLSRGRSLALNTLILRQEGGGKKFGFLMLKWVEC